MPLKLYYIKGSPPVRSVLLLAKYLHLDLETHEVNLQNQEHLSPWFKKLNPTSTIPTLEDSDAVVWDSHAILIYLAEKYGNNDKLYPKDPAKKHLINQILFYDCGTLFRRFSEAARPIFYDDAKSIPDDKITAIQATYACLEEILQTSKYLAGDDLTIADVSVVATFSCSLLIAPMDKETLPNLAAWHYGISQKSWYRANEEGLQILEMGFKAKLGR